jgi:hypothetical protein
MPPLDPLRIYFHLIDEPLKTGSADALLNDARLAVEGLAAIRWENGFPQINGRGGWDAVFYVDTAPDDVTWERWVKHLDVKGYHLCI